MNITKKDCLLGLSCLILGFSSFPLSAQAPVSDVSTSQRRVEIVDESGNSVSRYGNSSRNNAIQSEATDSGSLLRQLQQLQEEVAALRGQLEEQGYELQRMKQQQQDDFANLDRRTSGGSMPSNPVLPPSTISGPVDASTTSVPPQSASDNILRNSDGKEEYEAAYALLKAKDYNKASAAFKSFVSKYPTSDFAGNSWFWLGFVCQTQGDFDGAANAFSSLIERFPSHTKIDDAKYNLGKIYNQQGKTEQARSLLNEVSSGNSKAAPLAKSYLETM